MELGLEGSTEVVKRMKWYLAVWRSLRGVRNSLLIRCPAEIEHLEDELRQAQAATTNS